MKPRAPAAGHLRYAPALRAPLQAWIIDDRRTRGSDGGTRRAASGGVDETRSRRVATDPAGRMEPSRAGAADACRVVERSLPRPPSSCHRPSQRGPFILLLILLLFAVAPPVAWGQSMTAALGQVAAKIEQVPAIKSKNVAVGDFPLTTGLMSEMGTFVADQLDAALTGRASAAGFKVVTRSHLCQVIRENKLWVDDRFDPELHKKLGRFAQADFVLAGRVTGLGRQLALTVRLVDSETGQQVWAEALTVPLDEGLRALLERQLTGDGCGGQDVIVPPPESGFTLTVQGPSGFDQVRAIATAEPISLHASDFGGRPGATFRSLDRIQTRDLSVSIKSARDQVAPSKWAEDVIAVEVNR